MFTKLPGGESDNGFTVVRRGSPVTQFFIEYSEGERILKYPLENLVAGSVYRIDSRPIGQWIAPHDSDKVVPSEQPKIAGRIVDAMNYLGDRFVAF